MAGIRGFFKRPMVKRFGVTMPKPGRGIRVAVVEGRGFKRSAEKKRKIRPKRRTRKGR